MRGGQFDRVNLDEIVLGATVAHGGAGRIDFARILSADDVAGACNFVDLAVIPAGASIGRHRHAPDEEEYYLVLEGSGLMWRNDREFRVRAGDLVRNPPAGEHSLTNDGEGPLKLFVFELPTRDQPARAERP